MLLSDLIHNQLIQDLIVIYIVTMFGTNWSTFVDARVKQSQKNFENGLLCSYVPTCDHRGWASVDSRGII